MASVEHLGRDEVSNRDLYVLDAREPSEIPSTLSMKGRYFVALIAWDASNVPDPIVDTLARRLLAAGCVYVCCWGPGCSQVHDLFDEADIERAPNGPYLMSTWHKDEPLSEAIWFALFNAYPDDAFFSDCQSAIGISIGSSEWAGEIREAMVDPRKFNARVLASE